MKILTSPYVRRVTAVTAMLAHFACGSDNAPQHDLQLQDSALFLPSPPAEPQRPGDAQRGYTALLNNDYIGCGVPWSAYSSSFGETDPSDLVPGRNGRNAELPYHFSATTTERNVEIVFANCLTCHASRIAGQLVIGLGDSAGDFTGDTSIAAQLSGFLISDANERAEWSKWSERVTAVAPYIIPTTVGVNPADNLAAALFVHRDPETLAWSNTMLMPAPPTYVTPVDVPPWWNMRKKNAMFYSAGGRGDQARLMMIASTLCTDTVEESQAIDAYFPDIRAYITSIEPPHYPFAIDPALAQSGQVIFESTCSECHGTYGENGSYPNRIVSLHAIGTDPDLARGQGWLSEPFMKWFRASYFGEVARFERPQGYIAPPLDGVWATAPYLHNGSVPTVATLLNSAARPAYWTRTFDSDDYDPTQLGWHFSALPYGQDNAPDTRAPQQIYDTTQPGYDNHGHTFGDALTEAQRQAVIEYLKTL